MAAGDDGVPVFVKMCAKIIEDKALKSEGIYRVSGKKEDCLALQQRFDEGMYPISRSHFVALLGVDQLVTCCPVNCTASLTIIQ